MSKTPENSVDLTVKPLMTMSGHEDRIWKLEYLHEGTRIATCSHDKTVRIWNVENGEQEGTSMEYEDNLFALAVTRDGERILSGGKDTLARIRVWDVETLELIEEWESHIDAIWCIAVSPDDQLAASSDRGGKIVVREMKESGEIKHSINAGSGVRSVCFSPDGEKLACAVGSKPGVIHVYDVESGELILGPIKAHEDNIVFCVLWSLDGTQLFSSSADHTIRCWNSDTGESIGDPWTGHTDWIYSLSLSPDGTKLASASWDQTVRFWDAYSGDHIEQPLQHDDAVNAVSFSPCGEFVASAGSDNKVSIWRVPWWDDSQRQALHFLDLPAIYVPQGLFINHQAGEFDFLDLPASRRPITSSSRPLRHPVDSTTVPITTRVQRFLRGLVASRTSPPAQQAIELQPTRGHHFWKSPARMPLTEIAAGHAKNGVVVGRSVPRRRKNKNKADKSHKPRKPQTQTGSSAAEADVSSHAEASTSNAAASNSQANPSTSNVVPAGRASSFVESTAGSDDSWDDMDCGEKCVDYFCFGPRENRERFRPWKKKSREAMNAEEQAKKAKRKGKGKARRHQTPKVADPQNPVHPPPHLDPQRDGIKTLSLAPPSADEADPQRLILRLQEQNKQLRRQLDDAVAAMRNAGVRSDGLEKKVEELRHTSSHESDRPQEFHVPTEPSGSKSDTGPTPKLTSTSSNIRPEGRPSRFMQLNSDSLQAEERAKNSERGTALSHPTTKATQSQNAEHAPHHHDSQRDNVTMASAASSAAEEPDFQRAVLQLQEQVDKLRRRLDDPNRKAEEKEGLEENVNSGQGSDKLHAQMHTGSSFAEAGPTSHSDIGSFTLQADPSTTSDVPPSHVPHWQNDSQKDAISTGSSPQPTAADVADLRRLILQLQEQNEQFRQQFDDWKWKAETERHLLDKEVSELRSHGHEPDKPQGPQTHTDLRGAEAGPSASQATPSGSNSNAGAYTHLAGPSTFSNVPPKGLPSSSAPSNSDLTEGEEKAAPELRRNACHG